MDYAQAVEAGRVTDARLFYFHRDASEGHDLETPEGLRAAIVEASGPAAAWSDVEAIAAAWEDPETDRAYLERVWLNRLVKGGTQAFDVTRWAELVRPIGRSPPGDAITLGFDGAMFHDATGLVATHVETGFQWVAGRLGMSAGAAATGRFRPRRSTPRSVRRLFKEFTVWRLYADPPYWGSWIAQWAGDPALGAEKVIAWWTTRRRPMTYALKSYQTAIRSGDVSHDGDPRLTRHLGHARRHDLPGARDEQGNPLWLIRKDRPDSPHKIDLAMAAVLSWEARTDAIAAGVTNKPPRVQMLFMGR